MRGRQRPEQSQESRKIEIMRRAMGAAINKRGVGGTEKKGGYAPKPITLPKLPWDEGKES